MWNSFKFQEEQMRVQTKLLIISGKKKNRVLISLEGKSLFIHFWKNIFPGLLLIIKTVNCDQEVKIRLMIFFYLRQTKRKCSHLPIQFPNACNRQEQAKIWKANPSILGVWRDLSHLLLLPWVHIPGKVELRAGAGNQVPAIWNFRHLHHPMVLFSFLACSVPYDTRTELLIRIFT